MGWHCPKCGCESTKTIPTKQSESVGSCRVECVKCSRFVRWEDASPGGPRESTPVASTTTTSVIVEIAQPDLWLYVSRRLDLAWVPSGPHDRLWAVPVFTQGSTDTPRAFFRLSPAVLVWLKLAGEHLERETVAGRADRGQLDAYLEAMNEVWCFATKNLSGDAVRAARAAGKVELPDHAGPK